MQARLLPVLMLLLTEVATPQNWRRVEGTGIPAYSVAVNPQNKNTIWFGGHAKIFVSYDGGKTIGRVIESLTQRGSNYITAMLIHPRDTTFIIAGGLGCWQSHDNGNTWSHALPDSNISFNGEAIACEPLQPDTLYAAPFRNRQDSSRVFFRSFDRGLTWTPIPTGIHLSNLGFCSMSAGGNGLLLGGTGTLGIILRSTNYGDDWTIAYTSSNAFSEVPKVTFDRQNPNIVWATILGIGGAQDTDYLLKSTNYGATWRTLTLAGAPWAVEVDEQGRVYVGMFGAGLPGAYVSLDYGITWKNYRSGLPAIEGEGQVWMIKSNGEPFGIFLADGERGFFKLQNFDVVDVEEHTELPHRFALAQNYPNPFNPETVIRYSLSEDGPVEIVIYNLRGETIRVLRRQFERAGARAVVWDGRDENGAPASSGVYVYTMRAGRQAASRKALLLR